MLNQVFQSELGYIPLRGDDIFATHYKNSSYIWGPNTNDAIGTFFTKLCPDCFRYLPQGAHAGQEKYWPWFWLICPVYILVTPLSFGLSMIFDHKNFRNDMQALRQRLPSGKKA
jgi:hypothetical protein